MSVNTAGDFYEIFCPVCGMRLNHPNEAHFCAPRQNSFFYTTTPSTDDQILDTLKRILQLLEQMNKKL